MRDLEELKFIYPDCVKKCDVFGENLPFQSHFSGYVNTMLVTSICLNKNPSSTQSSNTQHIMNNYSNGLFNREQYSCETNNQHYVLQNNYHYNKIDTASTYDDYSCSQSTNNYATKTSSAINTFEFSSYDSSTVLFSDSNFLSSSAYLLSSGGDYYL